MRRAALLVGLLTCAIPEARAQDSLVTWDRLDVVARLRLQRGRRRR